MSPDLITALVALVLALASLAGAYANYLNHLSNRSAIADTNTRVSSAINGTPAGQLPSQATDKPFGPGPPASQNQPSA